MRTHYLRYATLALFSSALSLGQDVQPNPAPAPAAPAAPAEGGAERISISLPKATGNDIAQLYRQLTNKRVLVDSSAVAAEANIVVFGDLDDKEEAVKSFEKALLMNGFAVVPSGPDEVKIINVVKVAGASNLRVEAPPLITDEADLPQGDNVVTYIMPLKSILPEEAKKTFEAVVTQLHPYGSIVAVPNASALIITENASLIRQFIEIRDRIDKPSQRIEMRWISVQYADVETLATTLEKIYQPAQQTTAVTARNMRITNNRGQPQQPMVDLSEGTSDAPPQIIPDSRTSRLLLAGRPSVLEEIAALVKEFDTPSDTKNSLRRKLKYLTVLDFMPVAQNALLREVPTDPNNPNQANVQQQQQQNRNNQTANNNTRVSSEDLLTDPDETGAPESLIVGKTLLVADTITNSIIVKGPPQSISTINQLLDDIDRRGPQVIISTIFGQFRRTDNKEFGLDWLATLKKSGKFTWGGSDFNSGSGWNPSNPEGDPSYFNGSLAGLSLYGKFGGNINFLVRAAMDTGKFSVLSRPTIFTKNNKKAVINSGQRVAIPSSQQSSINSSGEGLVSNTSIDYMDVVLQLEVIPLVNSENEVTLQVGQSNQQITGYTKIGGTDSMDVPNLATQKLVTTVTIPNKGTVILGGLITKENTRQKNGIPILSDIPLLGWAFSSESVVAEEREIVIFIQPTIIMGDEDGYHAQLKERSRYQVTSEVFDMAEPGYLQNLDEGLLPQYMDNAPGTYEELEAPPAAPKQQKQKVAPAPANNNSGKETKKRSVGSLIRPFGQF